MSDNHDLLNDNDMCSFSGHEAEDMCFNCGDHTCGDGRVDVKGKIEIAVKRLIQLTKSIALVAEMALQASISASSNKGF